jgi:1-acyl-sn-glycerol-3-phosphate acyltransferase
MTINSLENEPHTSPRYNHQAFESRRRFLRFLIRWIGFTLLVKLDSVTGLENIPAKGPGILMINHIALVDPIAVMHVIPRRNIVPMAKIEVYNLPVVGIFPHLWGVIPVRREEADRRAIQMALDVLKAGELILIAPESTRSPQLQEAKEGVAYLASRSGVPVIPVAVEGTPGYPTYRYSRRWANPGVKIEFGPAFRYKPELKRPDRDTMRLMTDEAMFMLSGLLPPHRRGFYSDLSKASQETIEPNSLPKPG